MMTEAAVAALLPEDPAGDAAIRHSRSCRPTSPKAERTIPVLGRLVGLGLDKTIIVYSVHR